jgi:D-hydroxyproline dehydrogenase subunit alpha
VSSFDIAVVGAGPAGIAAACRAAGQGARVLLLDDNPAAGGQIWRGETAQPWIRKLQELGIEHRAGTAAVDAGVLECGRSIILATGAREIFLPFPGWTLPGVFGVGGIQALAKAGLPVRGKRVVVAGSGPLLLAAAALLVDRGASVRAVAEQADAAQLLRFTAALRHAPSKLLQAAALRLKLFGVPYLTNCWVEKVRGSGNASTVVLRSGARTSEIECDYVAVSYGLTPNSELASLLGCRTDSGFVRVDAQQRTSVGGVFAAGELTGIGGLERSLVEGEIAGICAAGSPDKAARLFHRRARLNRFSSALAEAFALRPELSAAATEDTFLCRCEDVRIGELKGMRSWREAKLATRCGMGPCQGRVCGDAAAVLFGWRAESVRPPVFPVKVDSLIGERQSE